MTEAVRPIANGMFADAVFGADGSTVYTAGSGTITAYSVATGAILHSWAVGTQIGGMDVTPDGHYLLAVERAAITDTHGTSDVAAWTTPVQVYRIDLLSNAVLTFSTVAQGRDGAFIDLAATSNDSAILTQAGSSLQPLTQLDIGTGTFTRLAAGPTFHNTPILTASSDGQRLLIGGGSLPASALSVVASDGSLIASHVGPGGFPFPANNGGGQAISPLGNHIAQNVGPLVLYDGQLQVVAQSSIIADLGLSPLQTAAFTGLVFSADGASLYALDESQNLVLQLAADDLHVIKGIAYTVTPSQLSTGFPDYGDHLQLAPDGQHLGVLTRDGFKLVDVDAPGAILGTGGADSIAGTANADTIFGFAGDDSVSADGGDDIIQGSAGNDFIDGGSGNDTAVLAGQTFLQSVVVLPNGDVRISSLEGVDTLRSVEQLRLNDFVVPISNFALVGTGANDDLTATDGIYYVAGLDGNDILRLADSSTTTLDGGAGDDSYYVRFASSSPAVIDASGVDTMYVDAAAGSGVYQVTAYTLPSGIENGVLQGNIFITLSGNALDNHLTGNALNNVLIGNDGNDVVAGGAGDDQLDGGAGTDIAVVGVARSAATIGVASDGSLTVSSSEGMDRLTNFETIRFADQDVAVSSLVITGTDGDDVLTGTSGGEFLIGLAGNDTLRGLGGDDTLIGGTASPFGSDMDYLDGGDGYDIAVVAGARLLSSVSVASNGDVVLRATSGTITLHDVEAVQFPSELVAIGDLAVIGTANADTLAATGASQALAGLDGNDVLDSGPFNFVFADGGAGDDVLISGAGIDHLTGGTGADIFRGTAANLNQDLILDFSGNDAIHITDASLNGFSATIQDQTLTYTGGSLILSAAPKAIRVSADPLGGIDITATTRVTQNDFNGDGKSDILWRSAGQVGNWLATGLGTFAANPSLSGVSSDWKIAGTGDFNGDGKTDLLWRNDDGRLGDWFGAAGGTFSVNPTLTVAGNDWQVAGTGDFNGDGRSDILWRNVGGSVGTWSADTNGNFSANATLYGVDNSWKIAGTGDFNGDGRADILWRNTSTGQLGDWLANTNGTFTPNATLSSAPLNWHIAETGDFNGDGRADILWRSDTGQVGDWLADANGNFTANATLSGAPLDWKIAETGDYNGDGRTDILWRNTSSGQVGDWLADANGNFTPNATLYGAPLDWNVASDHTFLV